MAPAIRGSFWKTEGHGLEMTMETSKQTQLELVLWLLKNDVRLFTKKVTLGGARKEFNKDRPKCDRISAKEFSDTVQEHCRYFQVAKRRGKLSAASFTEKRWLMIKRAVQQVKDDIAGIGIDQAVEVVRSKTACSREALRGLPGRMHYWKVTNS